MNNEDFKYLEKAVDNENNESIIDLTFDIIEDKKKDILDDLGLFKKDINEFLKKLNDYRYVDEMQELQYGAYYRWINLNNPDDLKLTIGGILCEIKVEDNVNIVFKNFMNKHFQINMEENLLFQKLTEQERIILYALDHLKN